MKANCLFQGKRCDMNYREAFHMNIFGILHTSSPGQNFAKGPGDSGNDVSTLEAIGSLIRFE